MSAPEQRGGIGGDAGRERPSARPMTAAEILRGKLRNVRASKYGGDYADCPGKHPAGRGLLSVGPGGLPVWKCDAGCGSGELALASLSTACAGRFHVLMRDGSASRQKVASSRRWAAGSLTEWPTLT